jgi:TonB family protein
VVRVVRLTAGPLATSRKLFAMTRQTSTGPRRLLCCLLLGFVFVLPGKAQDAGDRKIIRKVEAQYPAILKRRGIGGTVRLKVAVHADGSVKDVEILGGNPALADAAEKAVRQWKFAPGNEGSVTVAVNFDPNA